MDFLTSTVYTDPTVYDSAAFGQGNLPILLDDVSCNGDESTLTSCAYDSNTADCSHAEDAGVKCQYGIYTLGGVVILGTPYSSFLVST